MTTATDPVRVLAEQPERAAAVLAVLREIGTLHDSAARIVRRLIPAEYAALPMADRLTPADWADACAIRTRLDRQLDAARASVGPALRAAPDDDAAYLRWSLLSGLDHIGHTWRDAHHYGAFYTISPQMPVRAGLPAAALWQDAPDWVGDARRRASRLTAERFHAIAAHTCADTTMEVS